jgi:branched-chain amino acid transport system ATP-binding protein
MTGVSAYDDHTPILELRSVRAAYDGGIEVLHGIDLQVHRGQVVALLGPNGAGKTTTIRVASGLMRPTGGFLKVAGHDVTGASASSLARLGVRTVPEGRGVFPNLTVRENLRIATFTGCALSDIEERAYTRFPRLAERRGQLAGTMSGGEQQMLALARGLATDPVVLLLDELSMGLAPIIVGQLYEQVAAIAAEGVSVLVVEQFVRTVMSVADWTVLLAQGTVRNAAPTADFDDEVLANAYLGSS